MVPGDVLMKDTDRMGGVGTYKQGRTIHASVVGIFNMLESEEGPCCEVRLFIFYRLTLVRNDSKHTYTGSK